jgi:flagellar biosynthetic protein FlhB
MADQYDGQERTEQATPKRRQEARQRGDTARSRELVTMSMLMVGGGSMFFFAPYYTQGLYEISYRHFALSRERIFGDHALYNDLLSAMLDALTLLGPLLGVLFAAAFAATLMVGGWVFSFEAIGFKWERLDPVKGLGRVFGVKGLVEMSKALAKFALVAGVAIGFLWSKSGTLLSLGSSEVRPGMVASLHIVGLAFLVTSAATIVIAALDVPFQLWDHGRKLKMTKQQLKDEFKETEGKPELKSKMRAMQQEMAQRRMMEDVPKADVVVTNPEHYAVALRYDPETMAAPVVVAKGADKLAARIREVAAENRVTLFSAPPLARAIYFSTKLGREIPAGLYVAVAQVLAYVFQLRQQSGNNPQRPRVDELPIPDEYRRD